MVWEVAECSFRDDWVDEDAGVVENKEEDEARIFEQDNPEAWSQLSEEEKNLVAAIKYRSKIGGMGGDIVMLTHYYKLWMKRFAKKEWDVDKLRGFFNSKNLKWKDVGGVKKEDIILVLIIVYCNLFLI